MKKAVENTSLRYYVEAIAGYIVHASPKQSIAIGIEGEYGALKEAVLSSVSETVKAAGLFVVGIDVSRIESSEPLLAQLIVSTRRQLNVQLPISGRIVGFLRLALSVLRVRRRRGAAVKTGLVSLLYAVVVVEALLLIAHLGPRHVVELLLRTNTGLTQPGKSGASQNVAGNADVVKILHIVAEPLLVLVLVLLGVHAFGKVVPLPFPWRTATQGFGEEALLQHLAFDSQGLDELATTIGSLVPGSRVCIFVNGLDRSEPRLLREMLSIIRWISLRCSQTLITVTSLDLIYTTSALLCANREWFSLMETMTWGLDEDPRPSARGLAANFEDRVGEGRSEGIRIAYEQCNRVFDLNLALPRLTSSAMAMLLCSRVSSNRPFGLAQDLTYLEADIEAALEMAPFVFAYNFEGTLRFSQELRIVWLTVGSARRSRVGVEDKELTIEQAAKILLALRCWPDIRGELYRKPKLLAELEAIILGKHGFANLSMDLVISRWVRVSEMCALLRYGVVDVEGTSDMSNTTSGETGCERCRGGIAEGGCPGCGRDQASIDRKALQSLQQRGRFSLQNANVDLLLYADAVAFEEGVL